ncbi:MAG: radical SAM protein [Nitrospirota bacterium]|nr:radical SAM protein [Nitrospirota bacterium]
MANLVCSDSSGNIYDHPTLEMAACSGDRLVTVPRNELIPLPEESSFFSLPDSQALGWDKRARTFVPVQRMKFGRQSIPVTAVSAFLPAGYTRTHIPAAHYAAERKPLPLWCYTAIGWQDEGFVAAAVRVDVRDIHNPSIYDDSVLPKKITGRMKQKGAAQNRLLNQLVRCATEYHCFAAKNLFFSRFECPLPTSPTCNARCIGCLSFQSQSGCCASQERVNFVPTPEEIAGVAVPHLMRVKEGVASFGQGCEGEPLLQADTLEAAIRRIRAETELGTINLNTNGYSPEKVARLAEAGLDSIRVSVNSGLRETYDAYYRPMNYKFDDVVQTIKTAKDKGLYTTINLLVFPGVTDREEEVEGLFELVRQTGLDLIQMRNLNIDTELYLKNIPEAKGKAIGIRKMLRGIVKEFPKVEIGYFNRPKEWFGVRRCGELKL